MFNKQNLVMFFALSIGLWLGTSFHFGADSPPFIEELMQPNHMIGGLIGGLVGTIVSHYFNKRKGNSEQG